MNPSRDRKGAGGAERRSPMRAAREYSANRHQYLSDRARSVCADAAPAADAATQPLRGLNVEVTRRHLLQAATAVTIGFQGLHVLLAQDRRIADAPVTAGYGPLVPDPDRLLDLPRGFRYQVLSRAGTEMSDGLLVPGKPDGMCAFAASDGKTVLVRNHELEREWTDFGPYGAKNERFDRVARDRVYDAGQDGGPCIGGTTTLVFDTRTQKLEREFLSLAGTEYNCAGGPTPWGSWVSCEETVRRAGDGTLRDHGYAFEVPALTFDGPVRPVPLKAMGRFRHEAVAIDPGSGIVYQTEDREDGLITRFVPDAPGRLVEGGRLDALVVLDRSSCDTRNWRDKNGNPRAPEIAQGARLAAGWLPLDEIDNPRDDLRARGFDRGAARFARAEGMWWGRGAVYFACTDGGHAERGQIWRYEPGASESTAKPGERAGTLELFLEPNDPRLIDNADNLTMAPWGDLVVCEDGEGDQFLVGVTPTGALYRLARNAGSSSEFAGATFSPDGSTLFVNIQGTGLTIAITGPWHG